VKKLINSFKKRKQLTFITTSLLIMVLLSISPAAASVSNWDFSLQNPVLGDTLNVKGSASPGEKVDVFVNFEKTVPVSGGKFEYVLEDVKIPEGFNNLFKVEASGAKNLNVRVKMVIWITKSSDASGNTATVSQSNVPPGTYTIKIDGDAGGGVSQVNLKITAFQGIESDSNGDFSYSYNTKSVPPGNFEIKVGGITKDITIQPKEISGSTSGSSSGSTSGSSSGSTSGSISGSTSKSSLEKTGSSLEPATSKTLGKQGAAEASTLDEILEQKDTKKQLSGEGVQKSQSLLPDNYYLLAGLVAGLLILVIYSRRK